MCVCFYFLTPTNYSTLQTPTGSPTGKFSSVTNCLELVQAWQVKGSTWQNCPPLQATISNQGHLYFWSYWRLSSPQPHLRFDNLLELLTELKKALGSYFWLIIKDTTPRHQLPQERDGEGAWSSLVLCSCATLPAPRCTHHPEALWIPPFRVFMEVPLNHCPLVINSISSLSLPSPWVGKLGCKFQSSDHLMDSSGTQLPSWSSLGAHIDEFSINSGMLKRGLL